MTVNLANPAALLGVHDNVQIIYIINN